MRRTGPSDTTPEAARVLAEVYRSMPPWRKLQLQAADFRCEKSLHAAGHRARWPGATASEVRTAWNVARLGPGPWERLEDAPMDQPIDNVEVVREVVAIFDRMGIAYALGGSWASSFYGEPRSTRDADLTVEPFAGRETELVNSLGPDYYVSRDAIAQAIRERRTFNIINTAAGFKVDVFIRKDDEFSHSVLDRRAPVARPDDQGAPLVMISAEDIILHKLDWYRLGGEVSERQWLDVLGVLRVQAGRLDHAYLDRWAARLKVDDLLTQARQEAGR